ncbi:hypothetical protein N751_16175 [Legionella pneumophila str. Leg01/11]|nr:hypothetical protein N751_16175 [Legionella pneumophila str. Leg01/11]
MKIFDWLNSTCSTIKNVFANTGHNAHPFSDDNQNRINPASSLPMNGSVDIHSNPFGTGSSISHDPFLDHHNHFNDHSNSFNDYHNHHQHHDTFHNSASHHDYHDPFRNY